MISAVFHTFVYDPLYNGLIFLIDIVPGHDVGVAVIALTVVVRLILFPLSRRVVQTQIEMKKLAPQMEEIKKKHADDRQKQSEAILALYREHDVHPFSNVGLVLLQFPVLIALYWIFARGTLPAVHTELLYSFIPVPELVNMHFLGLIDVGTRSIILAVAAALTQYAYTRLAMGPRTRVPASDGSFSGDMARSMDLQMRFFLPGLIGVISLSTSAAVPLYWATANLFMIAQEYVAGRRFSGEHLT